MGFGFKGGFAAYVGGYNQAQDRARQQARQDSQDAMQKQEFESAQELRRMQLDDAKRAQDDAKGAREAAKGDPAPADTGVEFDGATYLPAAVAEASAPTDPAAPQDSNVSPAQPVPTAPKVPVRPDAGLAAATKFPIASRDGPDARAERLANYWGSKGNFEKEAQIRSTIKQDKLTDINLKTAQDAQAREAFNATALETFRTNGVFNGAAKMMTDTNAMGAEGYKFEAVPSADGKKMGFYKTDPKGNRTLADVYPNSKEGELALTQKFLKVPTDKLVDWHTDALKRATDNERWDKEFGQRDKQIAAQLEISKGQLAISGGHLALAKAEEARKVKAFADESKIPMGVKTAYGALEASAKAMDSALYKAQADGSFNPESPAGQALLKDRAIVSMRMSDLINPYIPTKAAPAASAPGDPLGFKGTRAPAAPAAPPGQSGMTLSDMVRQSRGMYPQQANQ